MLARSPDHVRVRSGSWERRARGNLAPTARNLISYAYVTKPP